MAVSAEEIRAFLAANPNMSDTDIAAYMQMYGVSPGQLVQATGLSPTDVLQRYNTAMSTLGIAQPGLQGAENAANQGLQSALQALVEQNKLAQAQYQSGLEASQQQFNQGRNDVSASTEAGAAAIGGAGAAGDAAIRAQIAEGQAALQPYRAMGEELINPLMGLSGARGQEAFDAAAVESPYTRYLQEQGERAVTRNSAALGGLGGGNVMLELQRQGQGLASQGLQQQFQNMSGLMGQGVNAAQGAASLSGSGAGSLGSLYQGQANALGGLFQGQANALGSLAQGAGNTQWSAGQTMGNATNQLGQNMAEGIFSTGQNIGQNRLVVGQQLANNDQASRMQMANLAAGQGQAVSDLYGVQSGNLANWLAQSGLAGADIERIIALAQAQTAQNQSGQQAGLGGIPGTTQTPGALQSIGSLLGGIGGAASGYAAIKNL
jgi:hypothetical protein